MANRKTPRVQPLHPALLVTIKDLVARLSGDREIPNSLQRSAICSPASRRATNCTLSSITEHSFQGIHFLLKKGESVTYVSGTFCYLCVGSLTGSNPTCPVCPVPGNVKWRFSSYRFKALAFMKHVD